MVVTQFVKLKKTFGGKVEMQKSVLLIVLCLTVSAQGVTWVDNFAGNEPNQTVWTFINPLGDASVTVGGGALSINVPAGANHDPSIPNTAPHLMANIQDVNFTIEAKFNSVPALAYQTQGLLVQQDSSNFIRFEVFSDGSNIRLYYAGFTDGVGDTPVNTVISDANSYYLRIDRQADQWTLYYSYDGNEWLSGTSFARAMVVSSVGIHAGNFGTGGDNAPSFAGVADYFSSTVAPIAREPNQFGLIVNVVGEGTVTKDPDKTDYTGGEQVTLTAIPNGNTEFIGWTGAVSGSSNPAVLTVTDNHIVTAVFDSNSHVRIWYGQQQLFARQGTPQKWVNILGNVTNPDNVKSLTYSLNGGPQLPLSMGPPNPRLVGAGDFNVEIACADLLSAPAQNVIEITATDLDDSVVAESVSCEYFNRNSWPLPYDVNWAAVTDISEVAQIVDGRWIAEPNGISTVVEGYDRAFAVGDMNNWRDYEVTVPITVHQSYHTPGQPGNQPAVGLAMRWTGHTQDGNQPALSYHPIGASVLFKWSDESSGLYKIYNHDYEAVGESNLPGTLQPEVTYIFKMRVDTISGEGGLYSFKVWENGQSEPNEWLLQRQESLADPQSGSVLFLAHHVDATFGNIAVTSTTPLFTIGGHVLDTNGLPVSGVTISGLPGNPVTDDNGFYAATVSNGWTWPVAPVKAGYTFDPPDRSYADVADDYSSEDYTATEIAPQGLPITITKFTVKAGKTRAASKDSFTIKGTFGAAAQDIAGSTAVYIRLINAGEMIFEGVIPYNSAKFKSGKYSYSRHKGDAVYVCSGKFDLNKKTFRITAKGIDLTGLNCPVNVELEWGNYLGVGQADENIVNGKRPIPMKLMSGYADDLYIDKASVHTSTKVNRDKLKVTGDIAFASGIEDLTQHQLTLYWGAQDFTVPAGGLKALTNGKFRWTRPKGDTNPVKKVVFNLQKCTFTIYVANTTIASRSGTVPLTIVYDAFDQTAAYHLR
jgi:regulation of enolase protein 1 (concanavalin A-like superfamily)